MTLSLASPRRCRRSLDRKATDAENRSQCRRREQPTLSAAASFSDSVSAGRWFAVRSRELIRILGTPSSHSLLGRHPRVAFFVAPPCRIESSNNSCLLIGCASYRADRAPLNRWTSEAVGFVRPSSQGRDDAGQFERQIARKKPRRIPALPHFR